MALGIIAFAASVSVQAYQVGSHWVQGQAGPGFFPFWLGVLLALCGAIILVREARAVNGKTFFHDRTGLVSVVKVTATAAGMLEAEKQFRKVIGYTELPRLAVAIERRLHLPQPNHITNQEATIAVTM